MRVLLDTHTLLWWLDGDRRLSRRAKLTIADDANDVLVSAASAWEIATKVRIGKLPGAVDVASDIAQAQIEDLPIVTNDDVFDDYDVTRLW